MVILHNFIFSKQQNEDSVVAFVEEIPAATTTIKSPLSIDVDVRNRIQLEDFGQETAPIRRKTNFPQV